MVKATKKGTSVNQYLSGLDIQRAKVSATVFYKRDHEPALIEGKKISGRKFLKFNLPHVLL
jgi:hypothetical protein